MINHHPTFEMLQSFVKGELPASLSVGINIHAEMCPECQNTISQLSEQVAEACFEFAGDDIHVAEKSQSENINNEIASTTETSFSLSLDEMDSMIDGITEDSRLASSTKAANKVITFRDQDFALPSVLSSLEIGNSAQIGKLSRARVLLEDGDLRTSLLHIEPGGSVPEHTHTGFEMTLLLDGSFKDDKGEYVKGDFIMLDKQHTHQPVSDNGCLCFTVLNDALHFTQGINRILNPIGPFIY